MSLRSFFAAPSAAVGVVTNEGVREEVQSAAPNLNETSLPFSIFSSSWQADKRPFQVELPFVVPAGGLKYGSTWAHVITFSFNTEDLVAEFIKFNPVAAVVDARFDFGLETGPGASYKFFSCVQPSAEALPTDTHHLLHVPGARREIRHAPHPGAVPGHVEGTLLLGSYGVSPLIKGNPVVGSQPRCLFGLSLRAPLRPPSGQQGDVGGTATLGGAGEPGAQSGARDRSDEEHDEDVAPVAASSVGTGKGAALTPALAGTEWLPAGIRVATVFLMFEVHRA